MPGSKLSWLDKKPLKQLKSPDNLETCFHSRYSILIILIMLPLAIIPAYNALYNPSTVNFIVSLLIGLFVFILFGFRYLIKGDRLIFKLWFIKYGEENIHSIKYIKRSYSPMGSNAGSLKRLYCSLKENSSYPMLLISPARESEFLNLLTKINPDIVINIPPESGIHRYIGWLI